MKGQNQPFLVFKTCSSPGNSLRSSDHYGPRHCAFGAYLLPMAHENMTYGPKWPVKILDGTQFYPDCAKIKNGIFQFSILVSIPRQTFRGKYLYPHHFIYTSLKSICLSFNLMHEIIDKVSYQIADAYPETWLDLGSEI